MTITETDVVQACRTLFGKEVNVSRDFLYYVQPSGVKSAYRRKAKEHHPDLFASHAPHVQQQQTALFREILDAYDTLNLFFKQREEVARSASLRSGANQAGRREKPAQPRPAQAASQPRDNTYFRGTVPSRSLQIGQYLYYRGKISFNALINALVWQRKQRPTLGDIALQWGWLDAAGLERIYKACNRPKKFGEKAVELGILTVFQVNTILMYQRSQQTRLGNFFVDNNILASDELEALVDDLKRHNAAVIAGMNHANRPHMHA